MSAIEIQRREDAIIADEYGCRFRRILPWRQRGASDDGMGIAIMPPGGATEPHEHDEVEHFLVIRGDGLVCVDGETASVASGDAVVVSPGQRHHFENPSADTSLEVLCLWTGSPFGVTS
jgi:mannose-6-phosphate isomerase-like protein (cupin superfamily)